MAKKPSGKAAARPAVPAGRKPSARALPAPSATPAKSAWSADGSFYAHLQPAVDTHVVRVHSAGRVVGRFAPDRGEKVLALHWLVLPGASAAEGSQRGKKRRKVDDAVDDEAPVAAPPQPALALGLDDGAVIVVHPSTSSVLFRLEDPAGSTAAVCSLACPPRADGPPLLWAADAAHTLRAYALGPSSGRLLGRAPLEPGYGAALAVRYASPTTARVLVSRFDVRFLDVALVASAALELAATPAGRATGHTDAVTALRWLDAEGAFASIAGDDCTVNLWRADGELVALATLAAPILSVDARDGLLVVVLADGTAQVLRLAPTLLAAGSQRAVAALSPDAGISPGVRAARLEGDGRLRVARGSELKPVFESVVRAPAANEPS